MNRIFQLRGIFSSNRPLANSIVGLVVGLIVSGVVAPAHCPVQAESPKTEPHPLNGRQYWDAIYMQGTKVGHSRTWETALAENGRRLLKIENATTLSLKRFNQQVEQQIDLVSVETPSGELIRCQAELKGAGVVMKMEGVVQGESLKMKITTKGKTTTSEILWRAEYGGFFAVERSLQRRPLKPGEKRRVRHLVPLLNLVAQTNLHGRQKENVALLSKSAPPRSLLRIEKTQQIGRVRIEETLWTDDAGQTLKSFVPAMRQEVFRTSREIALRAEKSPGFDVGFNPTVRIEKPLTRPHQTRRVVYRLHVTSGEARDLFVEGPSQSVKPIDKQTLELSVSAVTPDQPEKLTGPDQPPTESDRAPNNLIQSDDEKVLALAAEAQDRFGHDANTRPTKKQSWRLACTLERFVHRKIKAKNFTRAIDSAADTARSLEGDCTEHAMLLAALCRARRLPARVAFGLVYFPAAQGFAYHMWTEVWIHDRWIGLDATRGAGGVSAAYLKLNHSHLAGASAYSALLPVLQVLNRLELEIVQVE